ncbi:MAG: YggT family protein [Gemmatimonadota bacterium]
MIPIIVLTTKVVVVVIFGIAAMVAGTHWAVKSGHLQPFGVLPRTMRTLGQPFLRPFERSLYRGGGNPVNAPYMFFWVALLGGLAVIGLVQWLIGTIVSLVYSASSGPRGLLAFALNAFFSLLMLALFVRVLSSWFGVSPYSKPMRVVHVLTDWLLDPLRKIIPPFGMIDLTPMVAYLMLSLARWFVLGLL